MALHYDLTAIPEDVRTIEAEADKPNPYAPGEFYYRKGDRIMSPVTNALIWGTMAVGLGEIAEASREEFAFRIALYQAMFGALLREHRGDTGQIVDRPVTAADVIAHTGLKTNVSRETRAKWIKRMAESFERENRRTYERALDEATQREAAKAMGAGVERVTAVPTDTLEPVNR